jgi:hypothetical protein
MNKVSDSQKLVVVFQFFPTKKQLISEPCKFFIIILIFFNTFLTKFLNLGRFCHSVGNSFLRNDKRFLRNDKFNDLTSQAQAQTHENPSKRVLHNLPIIPEYAEASANEPPFQYDVPNSIAKQFRHR